MTDVADIFSDILGDNSKNLGIRGYLDTGIPELNYAISGRYRDGGIPMGRMVEIFGGASSGKTFLSTMTMIAAQKANGIAAFADHERSFEPTLAEKLGLSMNPAHFRYLRPMTFEESVAAAINAAHLSREKGFAVERPIVWVFDSVASMIPHDKLYDERGNLRKPGDYNMRDKLALATACSQNYPQLAQFAEDNNMTVLLLNQIRMKPGVMYGDPTTTPGGAAAEFYASVRVNVGKQEITNGKKGAERETLGFKVTAKIVKNKVARPFLSATWQVRFNNDGLGVTVDRVATLVDFLVRKGLVPKSGNYILWEGKKLYASQLETKLKADPDGVKRLMDLVPDEGHLEDVGETAIEGAIEPTSGEAEA